MNKVSLLNEIDWKISTTPVPYLDAVSFMEQRVSQIHKGTSPELIWLLEHPPIYTLGTSADPKDVLRTDVPTFETGRGGQVTFHGPGQRVIYVLLDLSRRGRDLRAYIATLEDWIISVLKILNIKAERRSGRVGLWVTNPDASEDKIAAIGVRIRRWVTYHGMALNVFPDLSYFEGIVPCGLKNFGVTSLEKLGSETSMTIIDSLLQKQAKIFFGKK